jgi:hypothetical protein
VKRFLTSGMPVALHMAALSLDWFAVLRRGKVDALPAVQ